MEFSFRWNKCSLLICARSCPTNIIEELGTDCLFVEISDHFIRYPFGTLVDFVCDGSGFPIVRLSSLAVPTRNVMENPHSSIVVQMPGWSGLTNARVTIFGEIYQLPAEMEPVAKEVSHQFSLLRLSEMFLAVPKANVERNEHLDGEHAVLQNARHQGHLFCRRVWNCPVDQCPRLYSCPTRSNHQCLYLGRIAGGYSSELFFELTREIKGIECEIWR